MSSHPCFYTNRHLLIPLLFLLISNFSQVRFIAEGRPISKLLEVSQEGSVEEKSGAMMKRSLIGSRPPSCDKVCSSCGHCKAVQVPITTKIKSKKSISKLSDSRLGIAYSRGDDISNYKPISWKCKCGDKIIDP